MFKERFRSDYGQKVHRKQTIHIVFMVVLALMVCAFLALVVINWKNRLGKDKKELLRLWDEGSYNKAFDLSRINLENNPMDYFFLTLHGFASYQLAIAQINNFDTLIYIDECIWSLRKALLTRNGINDGRVQYVLGKAYYYKGLGYADLAIRFLEAARALSYNTQDIVEYLGLSYAAVRDYRSSVAAFSQALNPLYEGGGENAPEGAFSDYPSDMLLLAIARSYIALEKPETAIAYLLHCIEISQDSNTVITARLSLGGVMAKAGDTAGAEAQYHTILEETGENAEAHYQLGELYIAGGDTTRARAEWRRAVRVDSTHAKARSRLNL
jgi:tetratricopeptide (TPR) repeat protein